MYTLSTDTELGSSLSALLVSLGSLQSETIINFDTGEVFDSEGGDDYMSATYYLEDRSNKYSIGVRCCIRRNFDTGNTEGSNVIMKMAYSIC